jgi:probable rRNA maturation factor
MKPAATIAVASPYIGWRRACPEAERLARNAARIALAVGIPATGRVPPAPVELGITLADDAQQRHLNNRFRGRDAPTNVLAFPAWEPGACAPPGALLLLGDVVLAFETVARETEEQGKPFADHLRHLIVHGVLHLLGCDHQTADEAFIMEAMETSILARLGVPDPYRDSAPPPVPTSVYP